MSAAQQESLGQRSRQREDGVGASEGEPPAQRQRTDGGELSPAAEALAVLAVPRQVQQEDQQGHGGYPRPHPWQQHGHHQSRSSRQLDTGLHSTHKVTLMFDLNGTLTSPTELRWSTGTHSVRPGIHHLHRLKKHYRLGIYSSASPRTVSEAVRLLEAAAGGSLFDRSLDLHRTHTMLAPAEHVAAGGKDHDTVKPLRPYFSRLHRVILIDDDSFKACPGEEGNLLHMVCWDGRNQDDTGVFHLVDVLLQLAEEVEGDAEADVRDLTAHASAQLRVLVEAGTTQHCNEQMEEQQEQQWDEQVSEKQEQEQQEQQCDEDQQQDEHWWGRQQQPQLEPAVEAHDGVGDGEVAADDPVSGED